MPKVVSKKNLSKLSTKSKTQKGGRKFHSNISISYNGNPQIPLKCSLCSKTDFKVKTQALKTKVKGFINFWGIWSNRYKIFTCTNCGHCETFSNNIKCNGKDCDKGLIDIL